MVIIGEATGLSQHHACRITGSPLSTCRYDAQHPFVDAHLSERITELALVRRCIGVLRPVGLHVSQKRVYRIYQLNVLSGFRFFARSH